MLIKGVSRIEAYLCEEGIARFCTVSTIITVYFVHSPLSICLVELQKALRRQHEEYAHALDQLQSEQKVR